jgi:elongation factor G
MQMHSNKQNPINKVVAGDIAAGVGFKDIKTGDTLVDEKHRIILESMSFPEPVIGYAIEAKTQADVDKLGGAIAKLVEETLHLLFRLMKKLDKQFYGEWVNFIWKSLLTGLKGNLK